MADPLSITDGALGLISAAHELTKSILAIKKFCEDVKNAPAELSLLASDIEHTNDLIRYHAGKATFGFGTEQTESIFMQSLYLCRQAIEPLESVVLSLQDGMRCKRKFATWKTAAQQSEWTSMRNKLSSSKLSLMMAFQVISSERTDSMLQTILTFASGQAQEQITVAEELNHLSDAVRCTSPGQTDEGSDRSTSAGIVARRPPGDKPKRFKLPD